MIPSLSHLKDNASHMLSVLCCKVIPHSLILECLGSIQISEHIKKFIKNTTDNWKQSYEKS